MCDGIPPRARVRQGPIDDSTRWNRSSVRAVILGVVRITSYAVASLALTVCAAACSSGAGKQSTPTTAISTTPSTTAAAVSVVVDGAGSLPRVTATQLRGRISEMATGRLVAGRLRRRPFVVPARLASGVRLVLRLGCRVDCYGQVLRQLRAVARNRVVVSLTDRAAPKNAYEHGSHTPSPER